MDFPHGKTITVKSVTTTTDDHGDSSEVPPSSSSWGPCAVAPRFANVSVDPRSVPVVVGLTVYGPTRSMNSDDRLVIDGLEYLLDGEPAVWENPFTGWAPGIEVPVKRAQSV